MSNCKILLNCNNKHDDQYEEKDDLSLILTTLNLNQNLIIEYFVNSILQLS